MTDIRDINTSCIGIIDVHAHVLPGVDDGSRTMEESVSLIRSAIDQGITNMIATPHYSRRHKIKGLEKLAEELQQQIRETCPDFSLFLGQETYYHEELPDRLEAGDALTMAGSRYVLVEFDPGVSYQMLFRGLHRLIGAGYMPILAHMERYLCLRQGKRVEEVLSLGCWMQMNYDSLTGHWYESEVRWCRRQVEEGHIHLLGTDMHRTDFRPPKIRPAWEWLDRHIGSHYLERMTRTNPMQIIQNEP